MKQWTDEVENQGGDNLEHHIVVEIGEVIRAFGGIGMS